MQAKIRSASVPKKRNYKVQEERIKRQEARRHRSLTFKERLRSTFIRSYNKENVTIKEEVVYGKVVIFGDEGVGKTSIIHRLSKNYFTSKYTPTACTTTFDISAIVECETLRLNDAAASDNGAELRKAAIINTIQSRKRRSSTVERVLSISCGEESKSSLQKIHNHTDVKEFKFQLVDDVYDAHLTAPIAYRATVSDAQGFILVCSYDKQNSIEYMKNIYADIKKLRQNDDVPIILIVNKSDLKPTIHCIDDFENDLNTFITENPLKYTCLSASNNDGFEKLTELMLNEMNTYDEEESKESNLPDYYAFIDEDKRKHGILHKWKVIM